ncbi:serine/arginine repetitive matrix protein 1-like protein [Carex littledalei]|uniref:Serine/arginine repetitive matrix protein 1-like protein n=1 Tax=Carex littledalei TaxID=544730 RepID=A0A833RGY6_9POAL|nr:serine/arginine repetitive matrix protein 1-like protein [Carex littledalei]
MKELLQTNNTTSFHIPLTAESMCDQDNKLNLRKPKKDAISESKLNSLHRWRSRSIDGASRPRVGSEWQELRRVNSTPNSATRSRPKWHYVMFGPAKVPSKMDMKDMRDRQVRNNLCEGIQRTRFSKRPWKFLQSLSCKAVEIGVVAEPPFAIDFIPNISC